MVGLMWPQVNKTGQAVGGGGEGGHLGKATRDFTPSRGIH